MTGYLPDFFYFVDDWDVESVVHNSYSKILFHQKSTRHNKGDDEEKEVGENQFVGDDERGDVYHFSSL